VVDCVCGDDFCQYLSRMLRFISLAKGPPGGWKDTHPQTLLPLRSHSFRGLMEKLRKALEAYGVELTETWQEEAQERMCLELPEGWCHDPENPQPYESALKRLGRKLWKQLHDKGKSLPVQLTEADQLELRLWLSLWERAVPNWGGCACRKNYQEIRAAHPPDFSSGPAFLAWTQEVHSLVSLKLGKPLWTGG
jgi:hypothetical protein